MASTTTLRAQNRRYWRRRGMVLTGLGTIGIVVVWITVGPKGIPASASYGEMLGLLAIWLMGSAVWAVADHRRSTRLYGSITGQLWWHRLVGSVGLILGFIHPQVIKASGVQVPQSVAMGLTQGLELVAILLVLWAFLAPGTRAAKWRGPLGAMARSRFDVWRLLHGVLGVFVLVAIWHSATDAIAGTWTVPVRITHAVVCVFAAFAVIDRLVFQRVREHTKEGTVRYVTRIGDEQVVLGIQPDKDMGFQPGHFVYLGTPSSKERPHPFTVAGVSDTGELQLGIKASGAGTSRLVATIQPGERVHLSPPQGELDYFTQPGSSVWVAGGVGITPMIAGIRQLPPGGPDGKLVLLWSRRSSAENEAVRELRAAATTHPNLTVACIDSTTEPRITAATVLAAGGVPPAEVHVRLCGPDGMVTAIVNGLEESGVPNDNIDIESFSFR